MPAGHDSQVVKGLEAHVDEEGHGSARRPDVHLDERLARGALEARDPSLELVLDRDARDGPQRERDVLGPEGRVDAIPRRTAAERAPEELTVSARSDREAR